MIKLPAWLWLWWKRPVSQEAAETLGNMLGVFLLSSCAAIGLWAAVVFGALAGLAVGFTLLAVLTATLAVLRLLVD